MKPARFASRQKPDSRGIQNNVAVGANIDSIDELASSCKRVAPWLQAMYPPMQKISQPIKANVTERTTSFSGAGSANILADTQYPKTDTSTKPQRATSPRCGSKPKIVEVNARNKNSANTTRKGIWRRQGGLIATLNLPRNPIRRRRIKTTSEAKSKNGVSLKKPWPPNRSTRSAPIKARLPTRQIYSSFINMSVRGKPVCQNFAALGPGWRTNIASRNPAMNLSYATLGRERLATPLYSLTHTCNAQLEPKQAPQETNRC